MSLVKFAGRALIYGGRGALGSKCVTTFRQKKFWVASVDTKENIHANCNIIINRGDSVQNQENLVRKVLSKGLGSKKLDAIICVAGSTLTGNAKNQLALRTETMLKDSMYPSLICASLATELLNEGGLLALSGAGEALEDTPKKIGFGLAKAAIHHLTKSLAGRGSGLPDNSLAVAILPMKLDTMQNRKSSPTADFSKWTPTDLVAEILLDWTQGKSRPDNGSLVQLITQKQRTKLMVL